MQNIYFNTEQTHEQSYFKKEREAIEIDEHEHLEINSDTTLS